MRHGNKDNHLGRTQAHRQAMLSNMASSLIMHKRIFTTVAKAKALRVFVEPIITRSKEDNTHSRRVVFGYLQNKESVNELFRNVAEKVKARPGGYTRIIKTGARPSDSAEMCFIELVDYNETMLTSTGATKSKRTRRGSSKAKEVAPKTASPKAEVPKAEEGHTEESKAPTAKEPKAETKTEAKAQAGAEAQEAEAKSQEKISEGPLTEEPQKEGDSDKEEGSQEDKPKA